MSIGSLSIEPDPRGTIGRNCRYRSLATETNLTEVIDSKPSDRRYSAQIDSVATFRFFWEEEASAHS